MDTIQIRLRTYGKVAKYGPDVYKVGHGERQLTAAGWVPVHRGDAYVYMRAPAGKATNRPVVEIAVPTEEQLKDFALALHAAGVRWRGEAFGWPASYTPHREGVRTHHVTRVELDKASGQVVGRDYDESTPYRDPARFTLGESQVWQRYASWDNGPDAEPRWGGYQGDD